MTDWIHVYTDKELAAHKPDCHIRLRFSMTVSTSMMQFPEYYGLDKPAKCTCGATKGERTE